MTTNQTNERPLLKPCPFCGGEAYEYTTPNEGAEIYDICYHVGCKDCSVNKYTIFKTRCVVLWNCRTREMELEAALKKLEDRLDRKLDNEENYGGRRIKELEQALKIAGEALEAHHKHDQESVEVYFEENSAPVDVSCNLGEAYSESGLCGKTVKALSLLQKTLSRDSLKSE